MIKLVLNICLGQNIAYFCLKTLWDVSILKLLQSLKYHVSNPKINN